MLVSIVANFYNSAPFIPRLIESVLAQTYEDWELICVNDCSPGRDLDILRRYEADPKAHGRIHVIDSPVNLGIPAAKKLGIDHAQGEYITFIDGDDRLRPHAIEAMLIPAMKHDIDLVIMDCRRIFELPHTRIPIRKVTLRSRADYNRVITRQEIMDRYIKAFFGVPTLNACAYWGKLYRRGVLERSTFKVPDITLYEDIFFCLHAMLASRNMMFVDYAGYDWRWGGLSSGSTLKFNSGVHDFKALQVARYFDSFFFTRIGLMEQYSIPGVLEPLLVELRNVLFDNFSQVARWRPLTPEASAIAGSFAEIYHMDAYRRLSQLTAMRPEASHSDPFLQAVLSDDRNEVYRLAHLEYRSHRMRRIAKRLLSL